MGTHPIFESDFDCLTVLEMTDRRESNAKSKMMSIPTLSDSVVLASSVPEFFSPPARNYQVTSASSGNVEIDLDFDLGLLTKDIPPPELFREENDVWDWEQEFSKLSSKKFCLKFFKF